MTPLARSLQCEVLLVGGYPPPIGGVAIHVQRLRELLGRTADVAVLDISGHSHPDWDEASARVFRAGTTPMGRALRALHLSARMDCDVVHVHAGGFRQLAWVAHPLLSAMPARARRLITIHSGSFPMAIASARRPQRWLYRGILGRFDKIICVSDQIRDSVHSLGISQERTVVIPAYLPPSPVADPVIDQQLAELRSGAEQLLLVSGYARSYYGFHVVLDALAREPSLRRRYGLVFAFYSQYEQPYHQSLLDRLRQEGWNAVTMDDLSSEQFAFLLSRVDTFVRPTDRDGDSVAVREAHTLGLQVIASDCVRRPDGCLLFRTMDDEDLARALRDAAEDRSRGTSTGSSALGWQALTEVYGDVGIEILPPEDSNRAPSGDGG